MNDKSQSNTENLLSNIKYMLDKRRKFGVKNILISGLVFTTKVSLEVLETIHEKLGTFCSGNSLIYIEVQPAITCSKLTKETQEQGNMKQGNM